MDRIEARLEPEDESTYAMDSAEALSELIDEQDVPEGVTVSTDTLYTLNFQTLRHASRATMPEMQRSAAL
jgi:hypothetical protein